MKTIFVLACLVAIALAAPTLESTTQGFVPAANGYEPWIPYAEGAGRDYEGNQPWIPIDEIEPEANAQLIDYEGGNNADA